MFEREFRAGTSHIRCNPSRRLFIWQVTTTAIDIPGEFYRCHVRGFSRRAREIWTRNHGATQTHLCRRPARRRQPIALPTRVSPLCILRRQMVGRSAWYRRIPEACAWLSGVPIERCSCYCNGRGTPENQKSLGKRPLSPFSNALNGCWAGAHGRKDTVHHYDRLDVRILRRYGCLETGSRFNFDSIRGRNAGARLVLSLGDQRGRCTIRLLHTRCNYCGVRKWLQCPVEGCGRRVGVLYLKGTSLGCRRCFGLSYCSQREESGTRRLRRARRIRAELGSSADVSLPLARPLRMHFRTYDRLGATSPSVLAAGFGVGRTRLLSCWVELAKN